ncbi:hypothetical protein FB45DRAFT_942947 [Roridomyces roridus]|uniref:Uncharacterized protein n=1 Tax=Roridomyces roridus TaxID=1738132 RepID=A0AAD7FC66_9AGAR|nr:hypothetical protein FB45DRAFT_942947 [Roridomyces roridus]
MSVSLSDFPLDILLELMKDLDLPDSSGCRKSLLFRADPSRTTNDSKTCISCSIVLHSPSFWIYSLRRLEEVHQRLLPYPSGTDITTLPVETLREAALHGYKLQKSWTADSLCPVSIRSFVVEPDSTGVCILPIGGTHMFLAISDSRLACLSANSGECLGSYDLDQSVRWSYGSSPFFSACLCFVGFASRSGNTLTLTLMVVDYFNPGAVIVAPRLSRTWICPDELVIDVVVTEHTVGAVTFRRGINDGPVINYCRIAHPETLHRLVLELDEYDPVTLSCLAIEGDFVVFAQNWGRSVQIKHAAAANTDTDTFKTHTAVHEITPIGIDDHSVLLQGCHLTHPTHGILSVTLSDVEVELEPAGNWYETHRVLFWPAKYNLPTADSDSVLTVRPVCWFEHTGYIDRIIVGSTGTSVVVIERNSFLLLQYVPEPIPRIDSRPMLIPPEVLNSVEYWALDERLGVLYLVDSKNHVRVISFV